MHTKYIMFQHRTYGQTPVVFPTTIQHDHMAKALRLLNLEPVRAGFCAIDSDGNYKTFGRSDSLNMESSVDDGIILDVCLT